jgi:HlyD family secretion protein
MILGAIGLLIIGGIVYFGFIKKSVPAYETYKVERSTVAQEVSVTGRVKAAEAVDLSFERNGRVSQVFIKVGDKVVSGKELIRLEASDLAAETKRAEANVLSALAGERQASAAVSSEQAKVDGLVGGTRPEEVQISQTKVTNAEQVLGDAENNLALVTAKADSDLASLYNGVPQLLSDALLEADDAVNKQIDDLFTNETSSPKLTYVTAATQAQIDAETGRSYMDSLLASFEVTVSGLGQSMVDRDKAMVNSLAKLQEVRDFLDDVAATLNTTTSLSATGSATFKGYLNTARANVNAQISLLTSRQEAINTQRSTNQVSISTAKQRVNDAQQGVDLAKAELNLKQAGATANELKTARAELERTKANLASASAAVAEARAGLDNARAQLSKAVIVAPFAGTVAKVEVKPGEIVAPTVVAVSLISEALYQIEADVPEADIAKIEVGRSAKVSLDAYGSEVIFDVIVVRIDPAERIIDGVATYRLLFQFAVNDPRIKSGMTANIDISGERRENALSVPLRTVLSRGDEKYVEVLRQDQVVEVAVTTGLRGSDGNVEILTGLNEGDEVILFNAANQ